MATLSAEFEAVLQATQGPVRWFLAGMGLPADAIDDVAQDAFLAYFRNPEAKPAGVEPGAWIHGIARNLAYAWFREHDRGGRMQLLDLIGEPGVEEAEDHDADRLAALRRCLESVTGPGRQLLQDHYIAGEQADAIARRRSQGPSAVRMALLRLRDQLRTCVERRLAGGHA